jgi:hypothetical protein
MTRRAALPTLQGYQLVMRRIAAIRDRTVRRETAEDCVREIAVLDGVLDLNAFLRACRGDQPASWPAPLTHPARV